MSRLNPFPVNLEKRILLAFITAHHPSRVPHVQSQRERMRSSPLPYVFVYGDASTQPSSQWRGAPLPDELVLPVNDTKPYMVHKDQFLFRWALEHGYNYVFRACDDSIVYPERILSNLDLLCRHDYAGTMCGYGRMNSLTDVFVLRYLDYMHGGVGIWLSETAMRMLIADPWRGPYSSPFSNKIEITPGNWFDGAWGIYWDDLWIGEVLKGNLGYNDPRRNHVYDNYLVHVYDDPTLFASNHPFDPSRVIATHSPAQMGTTDLRPGPYSTRTGELRMIGVNWSESKSDFKAVQP